MNCPNCGSDTYIRRTKDAARPERTRRCLACGRDFLTVELYAAQAEIQEQRAGHFQTMISPESRAAAHALVMAHQGGRA